MNKSDYNGLDALGELSRFSHLPIRMVLQYSLGKFIAYRNHYELIIRGHVISDRNDQRTHEQIRTVEEIVDRDKAGMIFSPKVGLHHNVAVLDYNDEFANIIVNENISFETIGDNTRVNNADLGILPIIVKQLVEKRIHLNQLIKQLPDNSVELKHCEQRAETIKKLLVCLYDTTDNVRSILNFKSIQVNELEKKGSIVILDIMKVINDPLSKVQGIEKLRELAMKIEAQFKDKTIFIIADMSAFHHIKKAAELLEYEKTLHKDLKVERWKELCLYHKRDFETMFTQVESDTLMSYHKDKVILVN